MLYSASLAAFIVAVMVAGNPFQATTTAQTSPTTNRLRAPEAKEKRPLSSGTTPTPVEKASEAPKSALQVRLSASRENAAMGSALAIRAEMTNVSSKDLFINPLYMPLLIPPEVDPNGPRMWYPLVPPCDPEREPERKGLSRFDCVTRLGPGSHTFALWQANKPALKGDKNDSWWKRRGFELLFSPGIYPLSVVVNYWDDPDKAQRRTLDAARVETAEIALPLSSPLLTIMIGAFIGGLVASALGFVIRKRRSADARVTVWIAIQDFLRPGAMGVIIAVIIQRLGGASFPISVTVNDLLGAICIGFIGGISGEAFLRGRVPSSGAPTGGQPAQPPQGETVRGAAAGQTP